MTDKNVCFQAKNNNGHYSLLTFIKKYIGKNKISGNIT